MKQDVVWLVGSRGMLGWEVEKALQKSKIPFFCTDLEVDITNLKSLQQFSRKQNFTWIVNCAAYTAVDDAEDDSELAYAVNATGAQNLAMVARNNEASIIHISTDYVFDGNADSPYDVNTKPNPRCVYGETKLAGEQLIESVTSKFYILRTAWLYGTNGKNFVSTMLQLMENRDSIQVVNDQHGTPTYAVDLASAIVEFVKKNLKKFGFYHYTNSGQTTWYNFAGEIYEKARGLGLLTRKCDISPIPSTEYPTKARRPPYSVLDCGKIERVLNIVRPDWRYGLDRYLRED